MIIDLYRRLIRNKMKTVLRPADEASNVFRDTRNNKLYILYCIF